MIASHGIDLLLDLCVEGSQRIIQVALCALHHLSMSRPLLRSILAESTQDEALLKAIAAGAVSS